MLGAIGKELTMASVASLNAIARKRARRETEAVATAAVVAADVGVRRTIVVSSDASGAITSTTYALDAKALLDSILAQTVGVPAAARTITKNANTTLTIT
jgi:hypothetical protein